MRFIRILFTAVAAFSSTAWALSVGDTAPLFSLQTYGGDTFDLAKQKGKVTVLFFFCGQ
jgi:peroxiredoxin